MEQEGLTAGVPAARRERRLAIGAVGLATIVWATGTVLVKWSSLGGLHFAMFRLWAGVVVSTVALVALRRRLTWPTLKACALGGVLFAADIALHFSAVKRTSIANVSLIGALAPVVIVAVSAWLLHERIPRRDVGLIVTSFAGVAIVAIGSSGSPTWSPVGDLLALAGVGTWTAYWFFSRRVRERTDSIEYFASVMIAGALVMTPLALLTSGIPDMPSARDWGAVWAVALFPGFVGHTLVIWSHRHVESWLSALITQCTPVIAALLAWLILGERITPLVAAGGVVVILATAAVIVGAARREARVVRDADVAV
jgi:drug/metabolite transporter (DMT)-like permease